MDYAKWYLKVIEVLEHQRQEYQTKEILFLCVYGRQFRGREVLDALKTKGNFFQNVKMNCLGSLYFLL